MGSVNEMWLPVQQCEFYEVSNLGHVRSMARTIVRKNGSPYRVKERILEHAKTPRGYEFVCLYGDEGSEQHYVHRLVAEAFLGDCPTGQEVNHKDGDKANNAVANLEYVTRSGNMQHARESGLIGDVSGVNNPRVKYTPDQIRRAYTLVESGASHKDAARQSGVDQGTIESVCSGKNWKSLGIKPIRRNPRYKEMVA